MEADQAQNIMQKEFCNMSQDELRAVWEILHALERKGFREVVYCIKCTRFDKYTKFCEKWQAKVCNEGFCYWGDKKEREV